MFKMLSTTLFWFAVCMATTGVSASSDELSRSKELVTRIETLKIEFSSMRSEIESLQSEKSSLQTQLGYCESELLESSKKVRQVATKLEDMQKLVKNQADASALQISQISELQSEYLAIDKKNKELLKETQSLGNKMTSMKKEIQLCGAKIKDNESKQTDDLDFVITQYESKILQLEEANADLMTQRQRNMNKIAKLEDSLSKAAQKLGAICPSCEIE